MVTVRLSFDSFRDAHAGATAVVVGKGPTLFDYRDLAAVADAAVFVNDAVALETNLTPAQPSWMFVHDPGQAAWFARGVRSVPVIPRDGKIVRGEDDPVVAALAAVVFYRWRTRAQDVVLAQSKEELARTEELYTDCGTIHSAVHFVWYCGFRRIRFVGCDGLSRDPRTSSLVDAPTGYDRRIENVSSSTPWGEFIRIRREQDRMCRVLGLETEYLGTPIERTPLQNASEAARTVLKDLRNKLRDSR